MSYAHWKPVSLLEAADGQQKRSSGIKLSWVCIMTLPLFGQETLENHHLWAPVSSSSKQGQKSQSQKISVRVNAVPWVKDLIPSKHSVKTVFFSPVFSILHKRPETTGLSKSCRQGGQRFAPDGDQMAPEQCYLRVPLVRWIYGKKKKRFWQRRKIDKITYISALIYYA